MALESKKVNQIPQDAIMLSEEDALKYHSKILSNWKTEKDVFAYKYGAVCLGFASMLTGIYINNHFRTKLRLFSYGRISSYLPICTAPAVSSFLVHREAILNNLVLLKQKECPICIEMRASALQSLLGAVIPCILAPVTSLGLAYRFNTYNLPLITYEPLESLKLIYKFMKPIKNILFGIFIGHALLGSAVTYFEARSIYNVDTKLTELEKNLEQSGAT